MPQTSPIFVNISAAGGWVTAAPLEDLKAMENFATPNGFQLKGQFIQFGLEFLIRF